MKWPEVGQPAVAFQREGHLQGAVSRQRRPGLQCGALTGPLEVWGLRGQELVFRRGLSQPQAGGLCFSTTKNSCASVLPQKGGGVFVAVSRRPSGRRACGWRVGHGPGHTASASGLLPPHRAGLA